MAERHCTEFECGEDDRWEDTPAYQTLLKCPSCRGFLPRDFPTTAMFKCKKCGVELMAFPHDPEDEDMEFGGKICPISKPKEAA